MKTPFLLIFMLLSLTAFTQPDNVKRFMFGIHGGFNQYHGELGNGWYATNQAAYSFGGVSVNYMLNRHFDVALFGTRGDVGYQLPWDQERVGAKNGFLLRKTDLSLFLRYYVIGRQYVVQPYIFAGGGILMQRARGDHFYPNQKGTNFSLPSGGFGFNIRLASFMVLQLQETFMYTSADYVDYRETGRNDMYLQHSVGLLFNFPDISGSKRDAPDLGVDKCPDLPKELQAKRASKKRTKARERAEKKRQ